MRIYEGVFKIVEWQRDAKDLKTHNIRFDDLNIIDLTFIQNAGM
jgi:hypothetical protein